MTRSMSHGSILRIGEAVGDTASRVDTPRSVSVSGRSVRGTCRGTPKGLGSENALE